jgi:hypothetical protein
LADHIEDGGPLQLETLLQRMHINGGVLRCARQIEECIEEGEGGTLLNG